MTGLEGPGRTRSRGGVLPYREAVELLRCIEIMGPANTAHCRHEVLGEPLPQPEFSSDAAITSPIPFGADAVRGGGRRATVNGIEVTMLPDAHSTDPAMRGRAKTEIKFNRHNISWGANRQGIVTRINGPPAPTATIQTTYGPGTGRGSSSGYGRGTTARDRQSGDTSLGFHEGRHGVDFLRYMAANPWPVFSGTKGMPVADVRTAAQAYLDAVKAYSETMNRLSVEETDCVGDTSAVSGDVRVICDAADHTGHDH